MMGNGVPLRVRATRGFTLVEILLVMAVLGILLAIAVPNVSRYVQTSRFQQGVRVFEEALLESRDTATRLSSPVRISIDAGTVTWIEIATSSTLGVRTIPFDVTVADGSRDITISGRGLPLVQEEFSLVRDALSADVFLLPTGAILR